MGDIEIPFVDRQFGRGLPAGIAGKDIGAQGDAGLGFRQIVALDRREKPLGRIGRARHLGCNRRGAGQYCDGANCCQYHTNRATEAARQAHPV